MGLFNLFYIHALKKVEIEDFTRHSWRHQFASNYVQNGTSLDVLQELGG
jgi:site-specific recombinase XerD